MYNSLQKNKKLRADKNSKYTMALNGIVCREDLPWMDENSKCGPMWTDPGPSPTWASVHLPHHSWLITLSLRTKGRFYPHLPFHPHLPGLELAPNVDGTWTDKLTTVECLVAYTHNLLHGIMFLIITGVLTILKSFILSVGNFDPVGCLTIETSWC